MEYLFSVSKSYGADLTVLNSDRVRKPLPSLPSITRSI